MKENAGAQSFDRGIWGETAYRYGESKWPIALIIAMFAGLDIYAAIVGRPVFSNASTAIWSILAIFVHNAILNGKPNVVLDAKRIFPFLWRSLVLLIPGLLVCIALLVASSGLKDHGNPRSLHLMPIYGAVSAITLGFLGTWLPSVVAQGADRSLAAAAKRGRSVFLYTTSRLLAGCLLTALIIIAVVSALSTLGSQLGLDVALGNGLEPFALLVSALTYAIVAFLVVMITVILSRAYFIAEAQNANNKSQSTAGLSEL